MSVDPTRDLEALVTGVRPIARPGEYVFVTSKRPVSEHALATVVEAEGVTSVIDRAVADELGLAYEFVGSWIELQVVSALDAVGLTAAVSAALAAAGIPCNMLAGFHHDHFVVPVQRRDAALTVLRELAENAKSLPPGRS